MTKPGAHVYSDAYGARRVCEGPGDSRGPCSTCLVGMALQSAEPSDGLAERLWWALLLWIACGWLLVGLLDGCVTRVTPCLSYEHGVRPPPGEYARRSVGASVCADVEPRPAPSEE